MSHKSGHIIIQSKSTVAGAPGITSAEVELDFPASMPLEERIKLVRHAMKGIDRLEHEDDEED